VVNFSWREYASNEVDFFWDVDFSQSLSCDFGEGAGDLPLPLGKAPMTHAFGSASTFSVVLTDHYAASYTKSTTKSVTTNGLSPAADFSQNVGGLTVFLQNTSTVRGVPQWDFGDGTVLFGERVYHKYPDVGTYSVTMTVAGYTNTQSVEIIPAIVLVWTEDSTSQTGWLIENSLDGGTTWNTVKTLSDGTLRTTNCDSSDGVDIFAYQLFRVTALASPTNSDPSNELGQECARI
jgi:PKD repeat protein